MVKPGRLFLRCLFKLLAGIRLDHHHVRLNASFHSDLRWWEDFLEAWKGTSILSRLSLDGLGRMNLVNCGAWWGHGCLWFAWPDKWGGGLEYHAEGVAELVI